MQIYSKSTKIELKNNCAGHLIYMSDFSLDVGIDAYLLTAFALKINPQIVNFVELGAGNGIASCLLAQELTHAKGLGIDILPQAIKTASENSDRLCLSKRVFFHLADISNVKALLALYGTHMGQKMAHAIICNPPYYKKGLGRLSNDEKRRTALHQNSDSLQIFFKAAHALLKHHGHFFCIYRPNDLVEILHKLEKNSFGLRHVLPIHSRPNKHAQWILLHAQKDSNSDVKIFPNLTIYKDKSSREMTTDMLKFCPWIK